MGYVYVMRNEYFKDDVLKIGKTNELPDKRAEELYSTGVPFPFKTIFIKDTDKYNELELFLHDKLKEKRINPNREFFSTTLKEIISLIDEFDKNNFIDKEKINKSVNSNVLIKIFPHSRSKDFFPTKQSIYNFFIDKIRTKDEVYVLGNNKSIGKLPKGTIVWIKYEHV